MGKYPALSFEHIRTNSFQGRRNLVTIENLANLSDPVVPWGDAAFEELVEHILEARPKGGAGHLVPRRARHQVRPFPLSYRVDQNGDHYPHCRKRRL